MRLCDSMPEYLAYVTEAEMNGDLCKMIPEDKRPQYQYSGEDVLAKIITKAVPPECVTTAQRLKGDATPLYVLPSPSLAIRAKSSKEDSGFIYITGSSSA
jgi:hypothetical protein